VIRIILHFLLLHDEWQYYFNVTFLSLLELDSNTGTY